MKAAEIANATRLPDRQGFRRPVVERRSLTAAFLKTLGIVVVALILCRIFLFEPFRISASSMAPTLNVGDRVLVFKPSYGFRPPIVEREIVRWAEPERGDVIVFRFPLDESRHYLKRVIAVPGDVIEIRGTEVSVNGEIIPKREISDPAAVAKIVGKEDFDGALFTETINGAIYHVLHSKPGSHAFTRNAGPRRLLRDEFFVLGDNRDQSDDSRSWGPVPRSNIEGKVRVMW